MQQEVAHKSFLVNQKAKDVKIAARLIADTKRVAKQAKFPLFIAYGNQQEGASFGERLTNEVVKIFAQDFSRIIIIGNDCPELQPQDLCTAHAHCAPQHIVIGPTQKGGSYLIAMHRDQFDPRQFRQLHWEHDSLLSSFRTYAALQQASIHWLASLRDINDPQSLQEVLQVLGLSDKFKRWLLSLSLRVPVTIIYQCVFYGLFNYLPQPSLRAP